MYLSDKHTVEDTIDALQLAQEFEWQGFDVSTQTEGDSSR
jgi:hypothetical protein